jgi:RNA polymerase sigma factor (TIGR02999 family)
VAPGRGGWLFGRCEDRAKALDEAQPAGQDEPGEHSMPSPDVTSLLHAWGEGDPAARDQLIPLVYDELRRRAAVYLRHERRDHTLQPTALVHEAYVRLAEQTRMDWKNRAQFFGVAAQMMRRILVDHARAGKMAKRSGTLIRVDLDERLGAQPAADIDVLALDDVLTRLAAFDSRKCAVAELKFFAGLSIDESAGVLGVSTATVEREWKAARAWLYAALTKAPREP